MFGEKFVCPLVIISPQSRHQLKEHNAKAESINFGAEAAVAQEFCRKIGLSPVDTGNLHGGIDCIRTLPGQPKVPDPWLTARIEEDIGRFDVSMDQWLLLEGVQILKAPKTEHNQKFPIESQLPCWTMSRRPGNELNSLNANFLRLLREIEKFSHVLKPHERLRLKAWVDKLKSPTAQRNIIEAEARNGLTKFLLICLKREKELLQPFNRNPRAAETLLQVLNSIVRTIFTGVFPVV